MPTQIQWRRGTTAQTASFTGATGEVTVDTTKKTLVVHDGVTPGGFPLSLESAQQDSFAYAHANSAYNTANTANTGAINAGNYANSAFNQANTADQRAVTSGTYANASYNQANTATTNSATADQRAVTSGTYANSAFNQANTATVNSLSAGSYANSAYIAANNAILYTDNAIANLVNSAPITLDTLNELAAALGDDPNFATTISTTIGITGSYANSAYSQANTATTNAATADQRAVTSGVYANSAYIHANAAFAAANNAVDTWVRDAANSASSYANSAFNKANTVILFGDETLTTNTANQVVDRYSTTEYRTAKYILQAISGADVHSEELLVTHNDTDVFFTEYAIITTANSLFNVYATIQSANVTINVSPVSANTQVDFSRISIIARELASLEGDLMSLSGTEDLESGSGVVDLMS